MKMGNEPTKNVDLTSLSQAKKRKRIHNQQAGLHGMKWTFLWTISNKKCCKKTAKTVDFSGKAIDMVCEGPVVDGFSSDEFHLPSNWLSKIRMTNEIQWVSN